MTEVRPAHFQRSGPRLIGLSIAEGSAPWEALGFAVQQGQITLDGFHIRFEPNEPSAALLFDRPHPGGEDSLDGIAWQVVPPPDRVESGEPQPNGIVSIDHLVLMAPDLGRLRASLRTAGCEIRRERPTTIAGSQVVQVFAWAGSTLLEVIAPAASASGADPASTDPASADPPSAEAAGADPLCTVWGLALSAPDLDQTVERLGENCGPPREAVQPGRRIATLRTRPLGIGPTLAVMDAHPGRHREFTKEQEILS